MAQNIAKEQFVQFYKKLTRNQKIIIVSVVGAVIFGFAILFAMISEPEMATLYNSLEHSDASKIVEQLKEKGIDYQLEDQGSTILIEKSRLYDVRLSLAAEGLPETSIVGYEIFDQTNLGMSEFVQKLNYQRALAGELERTISSTEEIKKARVHIVRPEKALFEKDQKPPTASISITFKSGRSKSKISVEGIQNLVAGSVEGMDPDHVTVVDQNGKILSEKSIDERSLAGLSSLQYEQKERVEKYLSSKVQSLLDGTLGPGNSEVKVNVELDFDQIEKTTTDFDPERQVERSAQTIDENSQSADSLNYPSVNMSKNQTNVITNYEISKTVERIVRGVGTIKRLTAAVLINYKKSERQEGEGKKKPDYNPRSPEEMSVLREIVYNAIGYDPSTKRNDKITVKEIDFFVETEEPVLKNWWDEQWWKDPTTLKLILLAALMIIIIITMFRLLRSKQIKERLRIAFTLPKAATIQEEEEEEELEELIIEDEDLLLLPSELPEQLLLESVEEEKKLEFPADEYEETPLDKEALAAKARAKLEETPELTEDAMMKLELKEKVQNFFNDETEDAVKIMKMVLVQDLGEGGLNL